MAEDMRDAIAEQAWGVLVAAQPDRTDDLNVVAHAIAQNLLPVVDRIAGKRAAEAEERAEMRSRGHARALGRIHRVREAHDWQCDCTEDDPCRIRAALDAEAGPSVG